LNPDIYIAMSTLGYVITLSQQVSLFLLAPSCGLTPLGCY
jgi:hypothetical protein